MEHRFCSYCGTKINVDAKFCSTCGRSVEAVNTEEAGEPVSKSPNYIFNGCTLKGVILNSINIFIVFFGLLALFFLLVKAEAELFPFGGSITTKVSGYTVIGDYPGLIASCGAWLGIYSLIYLITTIALLIVLVYKFIKGKLQAFSKMAILTVGISVLLAFIFMINGFIAKSTAEQSLEGMGSASTSAFIPFILQTIFGVSYFLLGKFMKE